MAGSHAAPARFKSTLTWTLALITFGLAVVLIAVLASYISLLSLNIISTAQESVFGILATSTVVLIICVAFVIVLANLLLSVLAVMLQRKPEMSDRRKMHIMQAQVFADMRLIDSGSK